MASPQLTAVQTYMTRWVVPLDDTSFKNFTVARDADPSFLGDPHSSVGIPTSGGTGTAGAALPLPAGAVCQTARGPGLSLGVDLAPGWMSPSPMCRACREVTRPV